MKWLSIFCALKYSKWWLLTVLEHRQLAPVENVTTIPALEQAQLFTEQLTLSNLIWFVVLNTAKHLDRKVYLHINNSQEFLNSSDLKSNIERPIIFFIILFFKSLFSVEISIGILWLKDNFTTWIRFSVTIKLSIFNTGQLMINYWLICI